MGESLLQVYPYDSLHADVRRKNIGCIDRIDRLHESFGTIKRIDRYRVCRTVQEHESPHRASIVLIKTSIHGLSIRCTYSHSVYLIIAYEYII